MADRIERSTSASNYESKVIDLLSHAEIYHEQFYQNQKFHGPSHFFHRRALEEVQSEDFSRALEYLYAVLASWGMHRMGKGGSKMAEFVDFERSMLAVKEQIGAAAHIRHDDMSERDWDTLEKIFKGIKVMHSKTSLVGNSKVMAHLLPRIVPPIDRKYTLTYLDGNGSITNDLDLEWKKMRSIIEHFFIPVVKDSGFSKLATKWMADQKRYHWDTSLFKIVDNLIVGA